MELNLVIQIWMAAIFTIWIYSIAFRDNDFFKFAEYTFVGAAAGHSLVYGIENLRRYGWDNLMGGAYLYVVVFLLGILLYSRYHPQYFWVSRYPLSVMVGLGIGLSMRAVVTAEFIAQIKSTAAVQILGVTDPIKLVSNIIFIVLVVTTVYFFLFTFPKAHEGGLGIIPKIARYGMMAAFSYSFANTVLSRYNMIFGRLDYIYNQWLPLPGAIIAFPIVLILLVYAMLPPEKRPWPKKA
ncbi:hypothetical protein A3K69_08280 [Candidatus Bathyarchaeota archaeon RBG_16_57_9]|nr:MAG: hypothetical protein A3K69_08280 [Candidatus Bathyarchaeota archaeon RBG_16_57_9]